MSSNAWAFNHRARKYDSDSDSDSEASSLDPGDPFLDFDLSNREETVIYKPNPFSIAKINASTRANQPPALPQNHTNKSKSTKSESAQTTIIDGFRNQAKKANAVAPSISRKPSPRSTSQKPALFENIPTKSEIDIGTAAPSKHPPQASQVPSFKGDRNSPDMPPEPVAHIPKNPLPRLPLILPLRPQTREEPPTFDSSPVQSTALSSQEVLSSPMNRLPASSLALLSRPIQMPAQPIRPLSFARRVLCPQLPAFHASSPVSSMNPVVPAQTSTDTVHPKYQASPTRTPHHKQSLEFALSTSISPRSSPLRSNSNAKGNFITTLNSNTRHKHALLRSPLSSPIPDGATPKRPRNWTVVRPTSQKPYSSLPTDEDEEWSTLGPAKKKLRLTGDRTSSKFTLRGLGLKSEGDGKKSGMSADSSRRVITFLPPPLKVKPKALPDVATLEGAFPEDLTPHHGDIDVDHHSNVESNLSPGPDHHAYIHENSSTPMHSSVEPRLSFQPYPSPQSALTPAITEAPAVSHSAIDASLATRSHHHSLSTYHPPSPPTSDPPQEVREGDLSVRIDMRGVSRRYPDTQTMMRK